MPSADPRHLGDAAACARMFGEFAKAAQRRAPLYARLATGIAADEELAGLVLASPPTQRQPVLLLACVHALLLDHPDDPLARFYPNLTADPDQGDPVPAFRALCCARHPELEALLASRSTQTNEIGRCALLLPALAMVAAEAGPIAHLDVGTSAGLNLLLGQYHYDYEPGGPVGPAAAVTLSCGTRGDVPVPSHLPDVAARRGLDRAPIDVHDEASARWLEACVWPDQTDRFNRLRAALELARSSALDVRRGDAVDDTPGHVDELAGLGHPVITNSWVLNYLTGPERSAYVAALDELGSRLDLSWAYVESPFLTPELPGPSDDASVDRTVLVLVRWRSGRRTADHLADAHPHGYWLHWQ